MSHANKQANKKISTHAPRTGSDERIRRLNEAVLHFNPRSPHGERPDGLHRFFQRLHDFNPRSPHGERLLDLGTVVRFPRTFQPTLPARGATKEEEKSNFFSGISTHAPRTGSDRGDGGHFRNRQDFNPRSPHGERLCCLRRGELQAEFQPTLPARGATFGDLQLRLALQNFNPRSPHGERQEAQRPCCAWADISTHAPRTGSD